MTGAAGGAQADGEIQRIGAAARQHDRLFFNGLAKALGSQRHFFFGAGVQHHQKLFAAVAAQAVTVAGLRQQPVGRLAQYLVPRRVAVLVVDAFEKIQVQHDHAQRQPSAFGKRQFVGQFLDDGAPVEQLRQRVVRGLLRQGAGGLVPDQQHVNAVGEVPAKDADELFVQLVEGLVSGGHAEKANGLLSPLKRDDQHLTHRRPAQDLGQVLQRIRLARVHQARQPQAPVVVVPGRQAVRAGHLRIAFDAVDQHEAVA